ASDRPKRGAHRVFVAWQSAATTAVGHLELTKGARSRAEEEAVITDLVLNAVAAATGADARLALPLVAEADVRQSRADAAPDGRALLAGELPLVARGSACADRLPQAIFPGAFNPLHVGHERLVAAARRILGFDVAYEISVANVDKPPLDYVEIAARLEQFKG